MLHDQCTKVKSYESEKAKKRFCEDCTVTISVFSQYKNEKKNK